jgi:hypothetical protein
MTTAAPIRAEDLARRPLTLVALEGETLLVSGRFAPGTAVTVGSNSGNALVIPPRFELVSYTLVTAGAVLHLAPPLFVQATVWIGEEPRELKGYFRDLRKRWGDLPNALPLASERFILRYATGIALMGRFAETDG